MRPHRTSRAEIVWDDYGVPHIYADSNESLFYAFGWAQAKAHSNLLLQIYGQSRGCAARYFGAAYLKSDRWVRMMGIPGRGRAWYEAQSNDFRILLDQFASGINAYVARAGSDISDELRRVLPVTGTDPVIHSHRVTHFRRLTSQFRLKTILGVTGLVHDDGGSNAWAIGPSRTTSKHAMLVSNPHLAWNEVYRFFEAHLCAPGVELYGATQVGFPVLRYSFNREIAFTQTVNPISALDLYRLEVSGHRYRFDEEWREFDCRREDVIIRLENGAETSEEFLVRSSVHGPVIWEGPRGSVALRLAGLDRPGMLEQYWRMGRSRNVKEFEHALRLSQIPMYNNLYADAEGHILFSYGGAVPRRKHGAPFNRGILPGNSSTNLWSDIHSYDELPTAIDPPGGFFQNANDGPWTCTLPSVFDPGLYPTYLAPRTISFRAQRSLRAVTAKDRWSLDDLCELKHSTHVEMGERLRDELVALALKSRSEKLQKCAATLANWDLSTEASSRGSVLFNVFARRFSGPEYIEQHSFATAFDPLNPLSTPSGIRNPSVALRMLEDSAAELENQYGRIDISWGEVFRFRSNEMDLPGNGGFGNLGILRTVTYATNGKNKGAAYHGDSYIACVEFSRPLHAFVLLGYGNASQPESSHRSDQLHFMSEKKLRPALLDRQAIGSQVTLHEWIR